MRTFLLLIVHLMLVLLTPLSSADDIASRVVISEVLWMGSDLSTADEWVELAVVGSQSVDVSGMSLTSVDGAGVEQTIARFATGTVLAAGEYAVISNYDAEQSRLLASPRLVSASMSLPNTKLLLRLRSASGALLDEVDDGIGAPFAGSNVSGQTKASMERVGLHGAGNDAANWVTAVRMEGWDVSAAMLGTPGFAREVSVVSSSSSQVSTSSGSGIAGSGSTTGTGETVVAISGSGSSSGTPIISTGAEIQVEPYTETVSLSTNIVQTAVLYISEVLPDAVGGDDASWIEIAATGSGGVALDGWSLAYGSKTYVLTGTLLAGHYMAIRKTLTSFSLSHSAGTVRLLQDGIERDVFTYHDLPEGISAGRESAAASLQTYCMPTEGAQNGEGEWAPSVQIQAGSLSGIGHVSVNFQAVAQASYAGPMTCVFAFGDGTESESCNPSYHSFDEPDSYEVSVRMTNYCGSTATQNLLVEVLPSSSSSAHVQTQASSQSPTMLAVALPPSSAPSSGSEQPSCARTHFDGVVISELLPNPVGSDTGNEWLELQNLTQESLALCGWSVAASGKPFELSGLTMRPGGYLYLPSSSTGVRLANESGAVLLFAPLRIGTGSRLAQRIAYENAKDGSALARSSGADYAWTIALTPGGKNVFGGESAQQADAENKEVEQIITEISGLRENNESTTSVQPFFQIQSKEVQSRTARTSRTVTNSGRSASSARTNVASGSSLLASLGGSGGGWTALPLLPIGGYFGVIAAAKVMKRRSGKAGSPETRSA